MKILMTGFEPFGGDTFNPSFEAVRRMPDKVAGVEIVKMELPTSFSRSASAIENAIRPVQPEAVISVGQAGGRCCVTVERVAINLADARIPDNDGAQPVDELLLADGPGDLSYTAGSYVCNCVMYHVLHLASSQYPRLRAGFLHLPYAEEQAVNKPSGTASMSLQTMTRDLEYAAEAIVNHLNII